jgi:thymidylate synthase
MWILNGREDIEYISKFNSKITNYSDDGKIFFGAYGPRYVAQVDYIRNILAADPWTRQAVMTIWRQNPPVTKDVPCTIMLHFIRRPITHLNLAVYMRSQDAWLGFPYDLHNFTCMQILMAADLNLQLGSFNFVQGSLHAYEKDFKIIKTLLDVPNDYVVECTPSDKLSLYTQKEKWMADYEIEKLRLKAIK